MSAGRARIWSGREWIEAPVASMKDEALVVPNIAPPTVGPGEPVGVKRHLEDRLELVGLVVAHRHSHPEGGDGDPEEVAHHAHTRLGVVPSLW